MGFFSDLKEDLSQAVNELMPEEEQIRLAGRTVWQEKTPANAAAQPSAQRSDAAVMTAMAGGNADASGNAGVTGTAGAAGIAGTAGNTGATGNAAAGIAGTTGNAAAGIAGMPGEAAAGTLRTDGNGNGAADELSVITASMTVTGDLITDGAVEVQGAVNGNITALGGLNVTGRINGNSKAAQVIAESAKITGEIVSEGAVKIGASSVVIGNISAASAVIAGAIKGDVDVRGAVVLEASAIVVGNIKSKSVQISNGAVIEGMCSQCYADISPTSFFEECRPEGRKEK